MNATLSFKEEVLLAISRLPNKASARQVRERVEVMAALRESEAASAQSGNVVPPVVCGTPASVSSPRSMATLLTPVGTPAGPESCAPGEPEYGAEVLSGE